MEALKAGHQGSLRELSVCNKAFPFFLRRRISTVVFFTIRATKHVCEFFPDKIDRALLKHVNKIVQIDYHIL
jgi:hypothetical protein